MDVHPRRFDNRKMKWKSRCDYAWEGVPVGRGAWNYSLYTGHVKGELEGEVDIAETREGTNAFMFDIRSVFISLLETFTCDLAVLFGSSSVTDLLHAMAAFGWWCTGTAEEVMKATMHIFQHFLTVDRRLGCTGVGRERGENEEEANESSSYTN